MITMKSVSLTILIGVITYMVIDTFIPLVQQSIDETIANPPSASALWDTFYPVIGIIMVFVFLIVIMQYIRCMSPTG